MNTFWVDLKRRKTQWIDSMDWKNMENKVMVVFYPKECTRGSLSARQAGAWQ
jgi:hypothetical protein